MTPSLRSMRNTLIITGTCRRDIDNARDWIVGIVVTAGMFGLFLVDPIVDAACGLLGIFGGG
jgi:hypothetical protein